MNSLASNITLSFCAILPPLRAFRLMHKFGPNMLLPLLLLLRKREGEKREKKRRKHFFRRCVTIEFALGKLFFLLLLFLHFFSSFLWSDIDQMLQFWIWKESEGGGRGKESIRNHQTKRMPKNQSMARYNLLNKSHKYPIRRFFY